MYCTTVRGPQSWEEKWKNPEGVGFAIFLVLGDAIVIRADKRFNPQTLVSIGVSRVCFLLARLTDGRRRFAGVQGWVRSYPH